MITRLEIQNYRSILQQRVDFSPLTVLVGPNASGKSNLIKAIEFLSDITTIGLTNATGKRGGFKELVPKKYKNLDNIEVGLSIELDMHYPVGWPAHYPHLSSLYSLNLRNDNDRAFVSAENLKVLHPLLFNEFAQNRPGSPIENSKRNAIDVDKLPSDSYFEILKSRKGNYDFKCKPRVTQDNYFNYLEWMGFVDFFGRIIAQFEIESFTGLNRSIRDFVNICRGENEFPEYESYLSKRYFVSDQSSHIGRIRELLTSFKRFDLLLNSLRHEQKLSFNKSLNNDGSNLPTMVRMLTSSSPDIWSRIENALINISPYYMKSRSLSIKGGKEYLAISEIFGGREVESWETADGLLRILGILIALETATKHSTVMIEEPENGLHPWAIKELMDYIREIISERKIQVIITTHSTQLLNCINPHELLVVDRTEKSGTTFTNARDLFYSDSLDMQEIGRLWNKGLLKGVPKPL